jgi:hypothetical protein
MPVSWRGGQEMHNDNHRRVSANSLSLWLFRKTTPLQAWRGSRRSRKWETVDILAGVVRRRVLPRSPGS